MQSSPQTQASRLTGATSTLSSGTIRRVRGLRGLSSLYVAAPDLHEMATSSTVSEPFCTNYSCPYLRSSAPEQQVSKHEAAVSSDLLLPIQYEVHQPPQLKIEPKLVSAPIYEKRDLGVVVAGRYFASGMVTSEPVTFEILRERYRTLSASNIDESPVLVPSTNTQGPSSDIREINPLPRTQYKSKPIVGPSQRRNITKKTTSVCELLQRKASHGNAKTKQKAKRLIISEPFNPRIVLNFANPSRSHPTPYRTPPPILGTEMAIELVQAMETIAKLEKEYSDLKTAYEEERSAAGQARAFSNHYKRLFEIQSKKRQQQET